MSNVGICGGSENVDLTCVIATYGEKKWQTLAFDRAVPSAVSQAHVYQIHHGDNLAASRNRGLRRVRTEWVMFCDADDELAIGYVDAMSQGTADVRGPMACYVDDDGNEQMWQPRVAGHEHDCEGDCLTEGNWLLIGSVVRTELLREVGGFRDFPVYEDWDLWARCYKAGATFELIRDAVYRAYVRPESRNRGARTRAEQVCAYQAIRRANFPEMYAV